MVNCCLLQVSIIAPGNRASPPVCKLAHGSAARTIIRIGLIPSKSVRGRTLGAKRHAIAGRRAMLHCDGFTGTVKYRKSFPTYSSIGHSQH